ncbi:MAG: O-antigen translocase [Verrucomicrobiota bacterium]
MNKDGKQTYGQILKSSVLIGGSSVFNIGLRIIRTKAMALILGPSGYGLMNSYWLITQFTSNVAGLGINNSGVRQIAEAVGTGDSGRIARTVTTLRRVALCSGAVGALLLFALSGPVSWLTFGDVRHVGAVALLSLAVLLGDISNAQAALVQGMRRIGDLARMSILGAFYGTVFSIVIVYYFYRQGAAEKGVAPSLVCLAAMSILTSWWYARKIKVERVLLTLRQVKDEASELVKLGVVFMSSGLITMGSAYFVNVLLLHKFGLAGAGFYSSAWTLGGYYVGFILQAMGTDFYPRLTAVAHDNTECNRLVNEQAEVGLLFAGPGVIATLTFAPLVIQLFYAAAFSPAVEILRWIGLGMLLRVASWPMAYLLVAKGERKLYFWSELLSNVLSVSLVWIGLVFFGLTGAGVAFFALYVVYWAGIYLVVRRVSGFRWSSANRQLALLILPTVTVVFAGWYLLPRPGAMVLGGMLTLLAGLYSAKTLCALVPLERFPMPARKLILFFRLAPSSTNG